MAVGKGRKKGREKSSRYTFPSFPSLLAFLLGLCRRYSSVLTDVSEELALRTFQDLRRWSRESSARSRLRLHRFYRYGRPPRVGLPDSRAEHRIRVNRCPRRFDRRQARTVPNTFLRRAFVRQEREERERVGVCEGGCRKLFRRSDVLESGDECVA